MTEQVYACRQCGVLTTSTRDGCSACGADENAFGSSIWYDRIDPGDLRV